MTITTEGQSKSHPAKHGPFAFANAMASAYSEWRAARSLYRIDDAGLKDICVSRGNIEWVVRSGEH